MTISTIPTIIGRIKTAEEDSPIAVFFVLTILGANRLNAVYGQTVATLARIKNDDPNLIGVFNKTMDIKAIRRKLKKFEGKEK